MTDSNNDPNSDAEIIARHRDYFRTVHPDIKAAALRDAEVKRTALANCQWQLQVAIGHLNTVLNGCRNHAEQQAADTAAREWLISIGSTQ
jgi:hypothetical protein